MSYNQIWMHAQNQPEWRNDPMGTSTIGQAGCFVSCVTYLWSRKTNTNHEIPDSVRWYNANGGFNSNNELLWSKVKELTGLTISLKPWFLLPYYTMRNVSVVGADKQLFSHWVVELHGGYMYCPLRCGGNFVHPINFHPFLGTKRYLR